MSAFALYQSERHGVPRWTLAGVAILAAHAAIVASVALWYAREPAEPHIIPAITVTLAPVEASAPEIQNQDVAVGPTMQQQDAAPPKEERKVEDKPVEQVEQPPPQPQAEVTLPQKEEKIDKPEPQPMTPVPETSAPRSTKVGEFTQAGSNAYDALVGGHLQRFLRYPKAGGGAVGKVGLQFVIGRDGAVISTEVTKSSGNRTLDHEALDIVQRASPFPPFPAAKPGSQGVYSWTVDFTHPH